MAAMAAIPIEKDAVIWARLHMRICPVTIGVLSVVSTMANSLIATACIARYACT